MTFRLIYKWPNDVNETEAGRANDDDSRTEDEDDEGKHENSKRTHESERFKQQW